MMIFRFILFFLYLILLLLTSIGVVDSYSVVCGNKKVLSTHNTNGIIRERPLRKHSIRTTPSSSYILSSTIPSDVESSIVGDDDNDLPYNIDNDTLIVNDTKRQLVELFASYDRGFGASPSSRQVIDRMIHQLEQYNTAQSVISTIIDPTTTTTTLSPPNFSIIGNWRMIYTTALDVLSLQASPLFITGAIYQVYDKSTTIVTNIIDFIPRIQSSFPSSIIPSTLIRAKVQTRACLPKKQLPNRIGLLFESVSVQPIQLFGLDSTALPPIAFDLPKLPTFGASSSSSSSSVATGYFDVTYLDDTLLIIRQNAPGGLFCLLRTDTIDP